MKGKNIGSVFSPLKEVKILSFHQNPFVNVHMFSDSSPIKRFEYNPLAYIQMFDAGGLFIFVLL